MVKFRLIALALSTLICGGLTYLAATHKITGIADLLDLTKAIQVQTERKPPPPPPPPPPPDKTPPPPPPPPPMTPPVDSTPTVAVEIPVTPPAPPPPPAAPVITNPTWVRKPTSRDLERFYPSRALDREKAGRVVVACTVKSDGTLTACSVTEESPEGWNFGEAALKMAQQAFKMAPQTVNGQPTSGGRVSVPIVFQVAG